MDKNTVYILQKDYEYPNGKVYKGVGHTIKEWQRYFPYLIGRDFDIKTDWFKPKEEPQWEILSFKNLRSGIVYVKKDNGKFNSGNGLDWDLEKFDIKDHEIINSVKRFPDNTVWSVDDDTQHGKITAFKITGNTMIAEIKHNAFPYYPFYLSELKAPKEEQVPIKVLSMNFVTQDITKSKNIYHIKVDSEIPESKYQSIKSAIEDVLNEDIKFKWHEFRPSPTEQQVNSPLFQAIWSVIKGWDIDTSDEKPRVNYHGANGSDVLLIMDSIKKMKLHTESELLQARRDGFYASRETTSFEVESNVIPKYMRFEDYINSLK